MLRTSGLLAIIDLRHDIGETSVIVGVVTRTVLLGLTPFVEVMIVSELPQSQRILTFYLHIIPFRVSHQHRSLSYNSRYLASPGNLCLNKSWALTIVRDIGYKPSKLTIGPDERLLAAARADNQELLAEIFEEGGFDINCQDG